jgi:hypothetical protein
MEIMEIEENEKNECLYVCQLCDYKCSYLSDWSRHLTTRKHLVSHNGNKMEINGNKLGEKNEPNEFHKCHTCNKIYKSLSGLWKHKKICKNNNIYDSLINEKNEENQIKVLTNLVLDVVKQNQDLTNKLVDICNKNNSNTNISNNNINSHNKTFNLQFFLNETCKDAMNIMDFVDSIKLQLSDLENVGNLGYVDGISKIIVKNLISLDESKRPVHCTDSKREVMYVKDEDKWEKENENKQKMRKMIKHVTHKNSKLLKEFKTKYPGCEKSESKFSDKYDKLIIEAMGGKGDNDVEKEDKIIRNIAKKVIIDKDVV